MHNLAIQIIDPCSLYASAYIGEVIYKEHTWDLRFSLYDVYVLEITSYMRVHTTESEFSLYVVTYLVTESSSGGFLIESHGHYLMD